MTAGNLSVQIRRMKYPGVAADLITDLELQIPAGQIAALVGPSGAGKTTLLRIIAGLERRYDGTIALDGHLVVQPRRSIQIVFQDNRLLPWKTVAENLAFASTYNHGDTENRIDRILAAFRLAAQKRSLPKTLSGGEEGRAVFARVFVSPPTVLLLDEPFRNLDFVLRTDLQQEFMRLVADNPMTVLLVSHSVEDVVLLSDVVYTLSAKPLRITGRFNIDAPRPRAVTDQRLVGVTSAILGHVLGHQSAH